MPIPFIAIGAGAVVGIAMEYAFAGGHPSRREIVTGGILGALPIGLGARATVKGLQKAKKLHKFGRHYQSGVMSYGSKVLGAASQRAGRWPNLSLRPEMFAISAGAGSNYVVGQLYDLQRQSRRDQHASRSGRSKSRTSTRGASTPGSSSKRRRAGTPKGKGTKSRRLSSRGRTTPWCSRHNRRHFCKYTRKR